MDRKAFETGILMGLCLPPVPQVSRGELLGYRYGDILLPPMEFEPEIYDYILRKHATVDIYYMRRSEANIRYLCYSDGTVGHNRYGDMSKEASKWPGEDFWYNYDGLYAGGIPLENVLWSYNDILYEDGTVAVKGSKPLPVYA